MAIAFGFEESWKGAIAQMNEVMSVLFGNAIAFSFERLVWECDRVLV
jgi:hypothetical protein